MPGELKNEEKMHRLSSNWTLFLKIFLPVFWISFFGGFVIASFVTSRLEVPQFTSDKFRLQAIIFVISGIIFFIFTFFRLKRIDAEGDFVFITNYFKTYRYSIDSIDEIIIYDHLILKAAHMKFKGKTSFGHKIIFMPNLIELKEFCELHSIKLSDYKPK